MAGTSLKLEKYKKLLTDLFPGGIAWEGKFDKSTNIKKLIDSLSIEACRVDDDGVAFIDNVFPDTTTTLIDDWERLLNLPDECEPEPENLTLSQRRQRVIQVLTTKGGQNVAFYERLVSNFGINIDVIDVQDQPPFRAGRARAGDRLTNGDWRYAFIVTAPVETATVFRAGIGRAGDRLRNFENNTIQCLINKHKPAHTIAIFAFTV